MGAFCRRRAGLGASPPRGLALCCTAPSITTIGHRTPRRGRRTRELTLDALPPADFVWCSRADVFLRPLAAREILQVGRADARRADERGAGASPGRRLPGALPGGSLRHEYRGGRRSALGRERQRLAIAQPRCSMDPPGMPSSIDERRAHSTQHRAPAPGTRSPKAMRVARCSSSPTAWHTVRAPTASSLHEGPDQSRGSYRRPRSAAAPACRAGARPQYFSARGLETAGVKPAAPPPAFNRTRNAGRSGAVAAAARDAPGEAVDGVREDRSAHLGQRVGDVRGRGAGPGRGRVRSAGDGSRSLRVASASPLEGTEIEAEISFVAKILPSSDRGRDRRMPPVCTAAPDTRGCVDSSAGRAPPARDLHRRSGRDRSGGWLASCSPRRRPSGRKPYAGNSPGEGRRQMVAVEREQVRSAGPHSVRRS